MESSTSSSAPRRTPASALTGVSAERDDAARGQGGSPRRHAGRRLPSGNWRRAHGHRRSLARSSAISEEEVEPPSSAAEVTARRCPSTTSATALTSSGSEVVATRGDGEAAGRPQQGQPGPRRRAEEQARVVAGGLAPGRARRPAPRARRRRCPPPAARLASMAAPPITSRLLGTGPGRRGGQQAVLGLPARVADAGPQQEPVALAEGKRVGARRSRRGSGWRSP